MLLGVVRFVVLVAAGGGGGGSDSCFGPAPPSTRSAAAAERLPTGPRPEEESEEGEGLTNLTLPARRRTAAPWCTRRADAGVPSGKTMLASIVFASIFGKTMNGTIPPLTIPMAIRSKATAVLPTTAGLRMERATNGSKNRVLMKSMVASVRTFNQSANACSRCHGR